MIGIRVIPLMAALAGAWSATASAAPTLLFEARSGQVLYAEDVDDEWYPASLTKIMTAYLTFEAIKAGRISLETKITVSEAAHAQPPSKVGLPVGGQMSVEMALQSLIVKSANDVAVMLAEAVGGSEAAFVEQMNATARRLGMTRTRFANANGLPAPDQVTTARDMARLSRAVVLDFPEYRGLWAQADVRIGKRRLGTHNSLLKTYEGADGLKTGFICDSGYNVVASATRDGRQLMAVVLGSNSALERAVRAATLLDHGFDTYGWKMLFGAPTLDTIPPAPESKSVVSIRTAVTSWSCGNRRPRVARKKPDAAAAKKTAADGGATQTLAPSPPQPAAATAAASAASTPRPAPKAKPKAAAAQSPPAAKVDKPGG